MEGTKSATSKSVMNFDARSKRSMSQSQSMSRMRMRKKSYGFGGVTSLKPVKQASQLPAEFRRPLLMFLNTYQLEPKVRFHRVNVGKAADELLDEHFTDHKYNVQDSPVLALRIAGELMRKCKEMYFDRYRIICVVTLAQKRSQSYNNAITFLWDHERDDYMNCQRETTTAFIQVTVFGIYLD